jgi:predicted short-subunit dehydrogenase-like oxidoreductase (DUF2520 family)
VTESVLSHYRAARMATRTPLTIVVVGRGRVGGALARALRRAGHRTRLVPGRSRAPRAPVDAILLCVPDAAVAACARRLAGSLAASSRPVVAHCAGALDLRPLSPLSSRGVPVGSLHPLQAVPSPTTRLAAFAAVEASSVRAGRLLERLARDAGMQPLRLKNPDRALYHAAAALAGNGLVALADRAAALLARAGASKEHSLEAVLALMRSSLEGVSREGLPRGLTGPVARGEVDVVRSHLAALARSSKGDLAVYRVLTGRLVELSRANRSKLAAIRAALTPRGRSR